MGQRACKIILLGSVYFSFCLVSAGIQAGEMNALEGFIKLMGGRIPFPPQKILEKLDQQKMNFTTVVIPNGRSLERRFTSYAQPRSLVALNLPGENQAGTGLEIFLAYTPGNEQLQIISRNRQTQAFDFNVLTQYGPGKKSHLETPFASGLCISCHQNRGPIFPAFPWDETDANFDVLERMKSEKHLDPFAKYILNPDGFTTTNPYEYDQRVRQVNFDRATKAVCITGCGKNLTCRKNIIAAAVGSTLGFEAFKQLYNRERIQEFQAAVLKDGDTALFTLPSDSLNNRKSLRSERFFRSGPGNDPLEPRPGAFDGINPILQSPFTLRRAEQISNAGMDCFSFTSAQSDQLKTLTPAYIRTRLESPEIEKLTENWPPDATSVYRAMFPNFSPVQVVPVENREPIYRALRNSVRDVRIGVTPLPHQKTEELFMHYCAACHFGQASPAPTLPLENLSRLKTFPLSAQRTVKKLISAPMRLMPPAGFYAYPTDQERQEMIEALE